MLNKVAILIKTFLRDRYLFETLQVIEREMPEAQMIVVDDGDQTAHKSSLYHRLRQKGHICLVTGFDTGFGFKSNLGAAAATRPYLLIGSDDFDFRGTRRGIEKLAAVLEAGVAEIASGRVRNNPYEGWLRDNPWTGVVREEYVDLRFPKVVNGIRFHPCDLTVNFSLIKREILGTNMGQVHWDDDIKIGGGEHGAFFLDVKHAGHRVVYVEGVNINEQATKPMDERYGAFRGRAKQPERPCFERRGVTQYYCFDGTADIKPPVIEPDAVVVNIKS